MSYTSFPVEKMLFNVRLGRIRRRTHSMNLYPPRKIRLLNTEQIREQDENQRIAEEAMAAEYAYAEQCLQESEHPDYRQKEEVDPFLEYCRTYDKDPFEVGEVCPHCHTYRVCSLCQRCPGCGEYKVYDDIYDYGQYEGFDCIKCSREP